MVCKLSHSLLTGMFLLLACAVCNAVEEPILGASRPARSICIGKKVLFTLSPARAGQAEIVVAPGASAYTRYAAEELSLFLKQILKTDIPVVTRPSGAAAHHFYLGISEYAVKAGFDVSKLCRDAFFLAARGNDVYILGRDDRKADPRYDLGPGGIWGRMREKGTLFGVYDFLERFGGCRFYGPGPMTVIPENRAIAVPEAEIYDRPDYEFRRVSIYSGCWSGDTAANAKPFATVLSAERDRFYDRLRLQTRIVPNSHGLNALGLVQRFGKAHPEYFALKSDGRRYNDPNMSFPGQLCYSSGIMQEILQDAVSLFKGENASVRKISPSGKAPYYFDPSAHQTPNADRPPIFGFMPQDAFVPCCCPKCAPLQKSPQAISDFVWGKGCELAETLNRMKLKGYVSMMSYTPYALVPNVTIPDNVLVMLATQGPWDIPAVQKKELEHIRAWNRKLGRKVWLWTYPGKFGTMEMPGIPDTTPKAVGTYFAGLKNDIAGAYMNSAVDNWLYHAMNYYVFSRVAWDNQADTGRILEEHYRLMYGDAAAEMRRIFERFEELWLTKIMGRTVFTALGPVSSPPSEAEVWNNVYSPQEIASLEAGFRKAASLVQGKYRERVLFMEREFLLPLKQKSKEFLLQNNALDGFRFTLSDAQTTFRLQPFRKADAAIRTAVEVKTDPEKLTVVFHCHEPELARRVAVPRKNGDSEIWKDDGVELFLSPGKDGKEYFQLLVNSKGSFTAFHHNTTAVKTCEPWTVSPALRVAETKGEWSASIAIPWRAFHGKYGQDFRANFVRVRNIGKAEELYSWSPFLKFGFQEPDAFGTLSWKKEAQNRIPGGGFQVKRHSSVLFGNWVMIPQGKKGLSMALDEQTFIDGDRSLRIANDTAEFSGYFQIRNSLKSMKPSTRYRLSFYMKTANVVPLRKSGGAMLNIWDGNNLWFPANWVSGTTPWRRYSFEFTTRPAAEGKVNYHVACCLYFATGQVWFDKIELQECP